MAALGGAGLFGTHVAGDPVPLEEISKNNLLGRQGPHGTDIVCMAAIIVLIARFSPAALTLINRAMGPAKQGAGETVTAEATHAP